MHRWLWMALALLLVLPRDGRLVAATNTPLVELPFQMRRGHIMVSAKVNNSGPYSFMVDSGYGLTMLRPDLAEQLNLKPGSKVTIVGVAGEEEATYYSGAEFDFNGTKFSPRRVAALPSQRNSRRQDGILGSSFFRRFVVEIDMPAKMVRLYEPQTFQSSGAGELVPIRFQRDTPIIPASVVLTNKQVIAGDFEIDTGCSSGVCFNPQFVQTNDLVKALGATSEGTRSGTGGSARVHSATIPQMQIGSNRVDKVSASLFNSGTPAGKGMAGHIGLDSFRGMRVIFDYSRKQLVVERPSVNE